jgi:hypothetical protein
VSRIVLVYSAISHARVSHTHRPKCKFFLCSVHEIKATHRLSRHCLLLKTGNKGIQRLEPEKRCLGLAYPEELC